ncbi:MAG: RHS repeat protein, partial [Rhodothermales bacterium]|nr:RHS repeat protein [Rhodothermales bacterium]
PNGPFVLVQQGDRFSFGHLAEGSVLVFRNGELRERHQNGQTIDFSWSGGDLTTVSDAFGNSLSISWSGGLIASISGGGQTVSFDYQNGLLATVTYAGGIDVDYLYDSGVISGLLTQRLLPSGVSRTTQAFDELGRVRTQADALGNLTEFTYGTEGTTVLHPDGTTASYRHDDNGRLTSMTLQDGSVVNLTQGEVGRTSVESIDGTTSRTLDPDSGLPVTLTGVDGGAVDIAYTTLEIAGVAMPQVSRVTYPDGQSTTYTYDASGRVTGYEAPGGGTFVYEYDGQGLLTSATNPLGGSTGFEYDGGGVLAGSTNEMGDRTTYGRDAQGRITLVSHPGGGTQTMQYDAAGRLISETDETGIVTTYAYDTDGNVTSVTDALGGQTSFAWDGMGRLTSLTDPAGLTTTVRYNQMGDAVEISNGRGGSHMYSYDALGRMTGSTRPDGSQIAFSRSEAGLLTGASFGARSMSQSLDAAGNVVMATSPTGRSTSFTLNALGARISVDDPNGGTTSISRSATGGITGITLPDGSMAEYVHNAWGQVTEVIDGIGSTWSRSYDVSGRPTGWTSPTGTSWTVEYDPRGNVAALAGPLGRTERTLDAAGRVLSESFGDGTSRSFSYDAAGRLVGAADVTLTLNSRGDVMSANEFVAERATDGQLTRQTWPGSEAVEYTYDQAGRLVTVRDWVGGETVFSYGSDGGLASISRPNDVTTEISRDADGLVASIEESKAEAVLSSTHVARDGLGNVTSADRTLPVEVNRVPAAFNTALNADGRSMEFAYDIGGRRVQDTRGDYSFDGQGRLTAVGTTVLEYDSFGSLTALNQVPTGTSYLTDVATIASIGEGVDRWRYVYTPSGRPLYRVAHADSARQFFHFDEMGNATILTDDSGAVVAAWAFDAYGRIVGQSGSIDSPFLFAGMHGVTTIPGSTLYRMGLRVYDATSARFLSPEPVKDILDPKALDQYGYAAQNPVRFIDPGGTKPKDAASADASSDFLSGLTGTFSAAGFWTDAAANGLGNSGIKGFLDGIKGTTPNGGLHRALRGDVVDAARDLSRLTQAGDARGAANAATKARVLAQEAKDVKKGGKLAGNVGNAATIAGVALAAYEAKGRFDKVDSDFDRALQSANRSFDNTVRNLSRLLKRGTITREEFQRRVKQAQDLFNDRLENEQWRHTLDLGVEGTRFLIKGLENLVPIPVISIGDIGMSAGSWLFGTPVPK